MRRLSWLFAAFCFGVIFVSGAQAQDTFELFGGYSYVRPPVTVTESPCLEACNSEVVETSTNRLNMNGFDVSGAVNATSWLGVMADFSANYGTAQGAPVHLQTYLFGPQIRFPGRVSPFAHVLVGGARETIGTSSVVLNNETVNSFAAGAGIGIDIKIAPFISFRPIQIDYLITRFGSATQSQPRASTGVVIHF
jgi:hypothetical protein